MRSLTPVLVLAAGRGSRMGGPKALMEVDGAPWWVRQSARLGAAGFGDEDVVWVASGAVAGAMRAGGAPPRCVVDADDGAPMFESVVAGLDYLRARVVAASRERLRGVFVLPVDVPAASGGVFDALAGQKGPASPEVNGERGHPMFLPWCWIDTNLAPEMIARLTPERRRLDEMTAAERCEVAVGDETVLVNLNRPEDLARWRGRNS